jgi:hypothetical protein
MVRRRWNGKRGGSEVDVRCGLLVVLGCHRGSDGGEAKETLWKV